MAFYNVYLHPLRRFPGPKLFAAFHLPCNYHFAKGTLVHRTKQLHDQYGSVVRISPNRLVFIDAQAWDDIYVNRGKPQFIKDEEFYRFAGDDHSLLTSPDAEHSRQRKLLSHAFSDKALSEQWDILKKYSSLLVSKLREKVVQTAEKQPTTVNFSTWYNYTTFDIIGDLAFGQSFGCLDQQELHPWVSIIMDSTKIAVWMGIIQSYPIPFLPVTLLAKLAASNTFVEHRKYSTAAAEKRMNDSTPRKDFMSQILRHNDERGMTRQEIADNAALLVIAGSETTATLLSGVTYLLLKNPVCYEKVRDEVRSAFKTEEEITFVNVSARLPYTAAVLQEGMRIYPPGAMALLRVINTKGGAMIAGHHVPESVSFKPFRRMTLIPPPVPLCVDPVPP